MNAVSAELRALLPTWAVAALLPVPAATFWHDGSGRAFAYAYLFVGAALVAAEAFRDAGRGGPGRWRAKTVALWVAAGGAAAVFTAVAWAVTGDPDPVVPVLAGLAVVPAVCCVPHLALASGRPHAAVVLAVLLLAGVKLAGCVVVRVVYGPTAQADGEMALPWEHPNLLVWLCLGGALACSAVLHPLGRRAYLKAGPAPAHSSAVVVA